MDIKELAGKLIAEVAAAAKEYSQLKGFNVSSLQGFIATTRIVVKRVEDEGVTSNLRGADKKALAIEIMLKVVPLPWYIAPIARTVLPHVIDAIVEALKDKFGK